jgi:hypothetical protein
MATENYAMPAPYCEKGVGYVHGVSRDRVRVTGFIFTLHFRAALFGIGALSSVHLPPPLVFFFFFFFFSSPFFFFFFSLPHHVEKNLLGLFMLLGGTSLFWNVPQPIHVLLCASFWVGFCVILSCEFDLLSPRSSFCMK